MKLDNNEEWIYLRLPFAREMDPLIAALIDEMRKPGSEIIYKEMFFVRYPEGGWHLRMRLKGVRSVYETRERLLSRYSRVCKAQGISSANHSSLAYEPEVSRYGGHLAMQLAEELFTCSSEIVGDLLKSPLSMTRKLGAALQSAVLTLAALEPSERQEISGWQPVFVLNRYPGTLQEKLLADVAERIQHDVHSFAPNIGRVLRDGRCGNTRTMAARWFRACRRYREDLAAAIDKQDAVLISDEAARSISETRSRLVRALPLANDAHRESDHAQLMIASIISSQIHMHANRVGILDPLEELYFRLAARAIIGDAQV